MVLEMLVGPKKAERHPLEIFLISMLYTIISIFIARALFPSETSILTIAFITIMFIPLFQSMFILEEEREEKDIIYEHKIPFQEHSKLLMVFTWFFLGIVVATTVVYTFFPNFNILSTDVFSLQVKTIQAIHGHVTGNYINPSTFMRIFTNNTKILLLIFLLSSLSGAAGLFIIAWNASIIGVFSSLAIAELEKTHGLVYSYIVGLTTSLLSISLHGIPEIAAYFLGAFAGGIISVGIIREKHKTKEMTQIVGDSIEVLLIAEVLIFFAAMIESLY